MISKIKFIFMTTLCVMSAMLAFAVAYALFRAPKYIGTRYYEPPSVSEASLPQAEEIEPVTEQLTPAFSSEDKIDEETNVVYEYFFAADGKTKRAEQKAPLPLIGVTRSQLLEKVEGWRVVSFSSDEVVLRKVIEATPTGTYILGIWNDHVAVFHGGQTSGTGLMEVTDTPVTSLSPEEHERLSEGIIIKTESELMKVLEDYGS